MKIALVSPYDLAYPGGVPVHVCRLQEIFLRKGHEAKIIAPSSRPQDVAHNPNFILLGRTVGIRSGGSIAHMSISPRLFFSSKLRKILVRENFDIIHLHEPLLPAVCVSVLHHSPCPVHVGTFHAYHGSHRGYRWWRPLLQRWFRRLNGKIAVSEPARKFISRYFPGEYRIIPNGVDLEHFSREVAPIEEYRDGKLNILFVGRFEKRKGLAYLLRAFRRVQEEVPNSRLLVIGPGPQQKYAKTIIENGLRDVVFSGFVPYEELPRYYRTCDLFCAPATGRESFGMVLLEAMAASKPIVASDIPGYAGVITCGVEGLLIEPAQEESLAQSLVRLLKDKALREEMGARGRLKAEQYSWERVGQQVIDYYQELLDSQR